MYTLNIHNYICQLSIRLKNFKKDKFLSSVGLEKKVQFNNGK